MVDPINHSEHTPDADPALHPTSSISESLARLSLGTREALVAAVTAGDSAKVAQCLQAGADPNWEDGGALGLAIRLERYELVSSLIAPGSRVPQVILTEAIKRQDVEAFKALTAAGASYLDEDGRCSVLQDVIDDDGLANAQISPPIEVSIDPVTQNICVTNIEKQQIRIIRSILETKPIVSGIRVYENQFSDIVPIPLWLQCEGAGELKYIVRKDSNVEGTQYAEDECSPGEYEVRELIDNILQLVFREPSLVAVAQEFVIQCINNNPESFKNPSLLCHWYAVVPSSFMNPSLTYENYCDLGPSLMDPSISTSQRMENAVIARSLFTPLVKHFAQEFQVTHEEVWTALQKGPIKFLQFLREHGLPSNRVAQDLILMSLDGLLPNEEMIYHVVKVDRKFSQYLPPQLEIQGMPWETLCLSKLRDEHVSATITNPEQDGTAERVGLDLPWACRGPSWPVEPVALYRFIMSQTVSPESDLFGNKILRNNYRVSFDRGGGVHKTHTFKFLSTCAAASAYLGMDRNHSSIYKDLVEFGMQRCEPLNGKRPGRLADLVNEYEQAFDALRDVRDIFDGFATHALLPLLACHQGGAHRLPNPLDPRQFMKSFRYRSSQITYEILFKGRSLLEISRLNLAWHRALRHHPSNSFEGVEWHAIIPETQLSDDYTVCAPTTPMQLRSEGRAMNNCLAAGLYDRGCLDGSHAILSMRFRGDPVVTLTLAPDSMSNEWLITQYQGRNHRPVTDQQSGMIQRLRDKLRTRQIRVGEHGIGQTDESKAALEQSTASDLEKSLQLSLDAFPREALDFYSTIVTAQHAGTRSPLLRSVDLERYIPWVWEVFEESLRYSENKG